MKREPDFDLLVIGGGPGGYVAALSAAQKGLKVACVDKRDSFGGTCLHVGCIPSKALLHATEIYEQMHGAAEEWGIFCQKREINFSELMQKKEKIVLKLSQGIDLLMKKNGVQVFSGQAILLSPHTVSIDHHAGHNQKKSKKDSTTQISARSILLATGSSPLSLPFLPFDKKCILSSTDLLSLSKIPRSMVIVGGGVIGLEMASIYHRLGTEVTIVESLSTIGGEIDPALQKALLQEQRKRGVVFHLNTKVVQATSHRKKGGCSVTLTLQDQQKREIQIESECVLVSIGRKPYTEGLGLENAGIQTDEKGFVPINHHFQTTVKSIYAIGDLVGNPMLAHKASEEGISVAHFLAGERHVVDYMSIPYVIYTFPEAAGVGMNEVQCHRENLQICTGTFPLRANSRACATLQKSGFVKVIAEKNSERILGVHIFAPHASELLPLATAAIIHRWKLSNLEKIPQAHPTFSEAIREAALAARQRALHI